MVLPRNVLIFHQAALGDFIITWPLAVALGRTFPQSRVIYVTAAQKGKLAEKVLGVESTDSEGGWHTLFAPDASPPPAARKLLSGAHTIISFISSGSDAWAANVGRLAPEAQLIALQTVPGANSPDAPSPARLPAELQGHVTGQLLEQLQPWPVIQMAMGQILSSVCDRGIGYRRNTVGADGPAYATVVIHPGGGKAEKCWPVEKFVSLIERLRGELPTAPPVVVLLGEVELEKWPRSHIDALRSAAEVRPLHSLDDLLKNVAAAKVFIGNDSGPGHLAGIIGVPTVSLFGGAPARWRPLGPRVRALQPESSTAGVSGIEVESVFASAREMLGAGPAGTATNE